MKLQLRSWAAQLDIRVSRVSPPQWKTGIASAIGRNKRHSFRVTAPLLITHSRTTSAIPQYIHVAYHSTSAQSNSPLPSSALETSSTVDRHVDNKKTKHGSLSTSFSAPPPLHRGVWTPEDDKKIEKLFLQGLSTIEIARQLGRTEMALRRHMASMRISARLSREKQLKRALRRTGHLTGLQFKLALSGELARGPKHFRNYLQNLRTKKYTSRGDQWSIAEDIALLKGHAHGVPLSLIHQKHFSLTRSEIALYSRVRLLRKEWSDRFILDLGDLTKQQPPSDGNTKDGP